MSENLVQYVIDAGKGDTSAMGMLYAKTLRTSYFLASKLSGSDAQATEITKKAYARAFCTIDKLLRPEAFEIWIKQIVASIYKDSVKFIFADADANAQEPTTDFLPEEVLADEEKSARVMDAVVKLTPERRTAVILHYYSGMPVNALSKFLGVSESTANAVLGKARADILAFSGLEAPEFPEAASLPVLTRVFQELTGKTAVDNGTVREMFTFAIEAYNEAKPKAESVEQEAEEAPAEEAEAIEENVETPAEEAAEEVVEETTEVPAEETAEESTEAPEEEGEAAAEETEEAVEEKAEEAPAAVEEAPAEEVSEEKDVEAEIDEEKAQMEEDILSFREKISSMLGVDIDKKSPEEASEDAVEEASADVEEETPDVPEIVAPAEEIPAPAEPVADEPADDAFERIKRSVEGYSDITDFGSDSDKEEEAVIPVTPVESAPVQEESVPVTIPSYGELPIEDKPEEKKPEKKEEKKAEKKAAKLNPKIIIAAVAILAVVIVGVVLLVTGGKGEDTPTTTTPVADTVKVPVEWTALPELSEYKNIEFLNEKVSSFKVSGKYGLIDYQGNVVLAAEYDGFERCSNGRYYGEGRLDESGYHILALKGKTAYEVVIMNGVAVVSNEPHADHATSNNTSMSGGDYDERDRYYEGYAAVRKDGKWGYVAQNSGKLVVPYEFEAVNKIPSDDPSASYDYCRGSSNGYVAVKKDGKMGVIKIEKDAYKVVVDFTYEEILQGEGGTFLAYNGKEWGNLKIGTVSDIGGAEAPSTTNEATTLPPPVTELQEVSIGKFVVNDDETNIRTSPDTDKDDNIITALNKGYELTAFEKKEGSNGSEWVRFEYQGKEAWISSKKLDKAD